ncbi:MAG: DNA mismatch repair endonuclease MutL [Clostridiales bacterium]|nr:DNA mismatch repair endonuclease MutL [Clostridiales bacterium]
MAAIRKLSQEIIGRIAAGEVVERPASVVKELVENAIDAGASHVTVEIRGGGVEYLRITDDGKGIPAEEIRMAFERHATSKLTSAEQLFDIHTLGFRGEALASVAAVAKVTCTTKTAGASLGVRVKVEGGEFVDIRQAASSVGTTFVVEDLFYNTPVRRKFLKKPGMEASLVSDYMLRLMLSHPEIAFRFVSQGKTLYQSVGDGKLESVLYSVYGKDAFSQLHRVSGNMNGLILEGYVGVGELSRGNRQQQSFFINGRYFRSSVISRALEMGCEGRVMVGRFPMCALFLQLPYSLVDVNVHPNKLEVRFQNENGIAEAVRTIVREALHGQTLGMQLIGGAATAAAEVKETAAQVSSSGFTVIRLGDEPEEEKNFREEKPLEKPVALEKDETNNSSSSLSVSAAVKEPKPAADPKPKRESAAVQPEESAVKTVPKMPPPIIVPQRPLGASMLHESSSSPIVAKAMLKMQASTKDKTLQEAEKQPFMKEKAKTPDTAVNIINQVAPELRPPLPETKAVDPTTGYEEEQTSLLPKVDAVNELRLIGIAFSTYWIFECGDKLLLLDQHAAHERILFDRLMQQFEGTSVSQRLLTPVLVEMTQHDLALVDELRDVLSDAGFDVQRFDESSAAIHAIPTFFGKNEDPRMLLLEALDEWQAGRGAVTRERMRRQIAQMACKHAIKGGDSLSKDEIHGFLKEMLASQSMPTCPHGRPIVTEMTRYALEKRFKRVQ